VKTHQRAWVIRAVVIAVTAAASLIGFTAPAYADGESLSNISLDPATINPGQVTTVHFTVQNTSGTKSDVAVASDNSKVTCASVCSWSQVAGIPPGGKQYDVQFRATGNFQHDEQATLTITAGSASNQQTLNITVPQVPTVPYVSGVVVDLYTGKGVKAAKVYLQDSAAPPHTYDTATDNDGKFKFTSTQDSPIMPGTLAFRVEKDQWLDPSPNHTALGQPGKPLTTVRLAISAVNASGSVTPSAVTSGGVTSPAATGGEETSTTTGNEPKSSLSWILIGIGGVLVLLGIAAITLLFVRRRDDGDDDDPRSPRRGPPGRGGPGRGPAPYGPHRGPPGMRPDPTRGMRPPVSPGPRGADHTMIARSPLADIPTQMHGRMPPDHVDPYSAPGRHAGPGPQGYGAAAYPGGAGGYGDPRAGEDPRAPRSGRHLDWTDE
jgi:hypothetical protein